MIELRDDLRERGWTASLPTRFEAKVEKSSTCWLWLGSIDSNGYGRIRPGGRETQPEYAHRVAFELYSGSIPEGLTIDHVAARGCRSRSCVNPAHLEAVTNRENSLRGNAPAILRHHAGQCAAGHRDAEHASRRKSDGTISYCRACRREARAAA